MMTTILRAAAASFLGLALLTLAPDTLGDEISLLAGTGEKGYSGEGGPAAEARLNNPYGIIVGPDGDIYFCDIGNHVVRKISRKTGVITTVAGTGKQGYSGDGGPALEADLNEPYEVRFAPNGDLYFVEMKNHIVRKIDGRTGLISTVAGTGEAGFGGDGGPATEARLNQPHSIQFDAEGNLYICDIKNHRVRKVSTNTGTIETFCGNGKAQPTPDGAPIGPDTPLKGPRALDIDQDGNLWLALREGNSVYKMNLKTGKLEHMAGTGEKGFTGNGGPAKDATLSGPKGVAIAPDGNVYLADTESHSVRMIDPSKNPPTLELIAGDGKRGDGPDEGDPLKCQMARLHGIGVDPHTGEVFVGDSETNKLRVITPDGAPGAEAKSRFHLEDHAVEEFEIAGHRALVVKPEKPLAGNPWIWRCRFLGAFAQADTALLERGYHLGFVDVANLFGGPEAMNLYEQFYNMVTKEFSLAPKAVMEGFSRGGLPAMNWSILHPDRVSGIYLDAPVQDIRSWPKPASEKLWDTCLEAYGLTRETAETWKGPLDTLAPLAKAGVPILSICGGADAVVPFAENSAILEERYQALGGSIEVIVKATCDHHPHSLHDPARIVEWIESLQ